GPAIVETSPVAVIRRIALPSATKVSPDVSAATARTDVKRASLATPSAKPVAPALPATVRTITLEEPGPPALFVTASGGAGVFVLASTVTLNSKAFTP